MAATRENGTGRLATNRKARHEFAILERVEAGIELRGSEVKSIRDGHASLAGAFARIFDGQAYIVNMHVPPYDHGGSFNHDPDRRRRLLLHRREILKLERQAEAERMTLIPLSLYTKAGRIKIEIGVCRGKSRGDKRETLRRKEAERDAARAAAHYRRR